MCKLNAATVAADGKVLGQAIDEIAAGIQPEDPTLATQLETAATGIVNATANWQEGSATADLEDAENAVVVVLNLIPITSPYANLVAIAFAGLNLLIANTQTQTQQAAATSSIAKVMIVAHAAEANPTNSPWFGKAKVDSHHGNFRKGFENSWNAEASAHPELKVSPITL